MNDPLDLFLPPVVEWFRTSLGEPTAPQRQGWPSIAAGRHTLILAPTGSGKTLAAFLACLDALWRQPTPAPGIQVLYISPLKALNNDIFRNLQVPLNGVQATAERMGTTLPALDVAIRTGDTPAAERQRLLRKPPHVLITTPESLHLLLTAQARERLTTVRYCIVDEIHALCPNKRGVFLTLLLERLEELNPNSFVRIGLSATQRPLDEVARFLGGRALDRASGELRPRSVAIIDAGVRKDLDLRVVSPVSQFGALPEKTIWPSIYRLLREQIDQHRSTIVFANNRRGVERITSQLNEEGASAEVIARAHHGSIALDVRQATEQAIKEGRLKAVVATASLELGIDMGSVDLVCQVESPGSVSRGLQRVGRAGHIVGHRSRGRLIPKTLPDLLDQCVLAHEMMAGNVEPVQTPQNCLDVLAQQVVAMTALEPWDANALFAVARRAYPFAQLTPQVFETVLEMVSGRYEWQDSAGAARGMLRALEPRVSWDRVHNRLHALPGSQRLALVNGGAIPDTGQYAVYTMNRVRIGELDEEFIYERRVGDVFVLGTNVWRLEDIQPDRVLVSPAEGMPALMPFWRGEQAARSYELGVARGRFLRELADRVVDADAIAWLEEDYRLDAAAANNLRQYVRRQLDRMGALPTHETICIEAARDQLGDWQVIVHSPLGGRFHFGLRLALERALTTRLGYRPQCLHHDDGILIRLSDCDEPIVDVFAGISPENVEELILDELADSALFALRFRQNAARALLFPRVAAGKRAPLWLQRLRGRDLLQVAKRHPNFPVLTETFRECLQDHLDVPRVRQFIADIADGRVAVHVRRLESPSPFAANLLFAFNAAFMYTGDGAAAESQAPAALDRQLLDQLVGNDADQPLLDARAIIQVERRLRGLGRPPRSAAEMAEWLRRMGDITESDLEGSMGEYLADLTADGRAMRIHLPRTADAKRWVLVEEAACYERAFERGPEQEASAERILRRFLETHALVSLQDVLNRYPFDAHWAESKLRSWESTGRAAPIRTAPETPVQWSAPENLDQLQRSTLAFLRREVVTCPAAQFVDFVLRWQGLHPAEGSVSEAPPERLGGVLHRLRGLYLPAALLSRTVLPSRCPGYQPRWLDELIASGEWTWTGYGNQEGVDVALLRREELAHLAPPAADAVTLDDSGACVLEALRRGGALFVSDLAQQTLLPPDTVRDALWKLLQAGLATNDHFDVIRQRQPAAAPPAGTERSVQLRGRVRRPLSVSEGRWSLLAWGQPEVEARLYFAANLLLERYGIVSRELALLDPHMPPWRVLYEVLSRMELAGEVRRGYFVEGLSGAQFGLPEAVQRLQELHTPSTAREPALLINALDPANLFGPFDLPSPLMRRAVNWLVIRAGRPLLLAENHAARITTPLNTTGEDLQEATCCLAAILTHCGTELRHKLSISEWNGQPVTISPGRSHLEAAGFVPDYRSMTLYAQAR